MLRLHSCTEYDIALVVQGNEVSLCLCLAIVARKSNLIHAWVDSHHAVKAQLLTARLLLVPRLVRVLLSIHNACVSLGMALVGVQHDDLWVFKIGKDVRLKRDGCAESVVTVNDQKQDCIVLWKIRNCKGASSSVAHLEFELVTSLQWCLEVPASLVRHCAILSHLLSLSSEYIQRCANRIGVAYPQLVLELQRLNKAL